MVIRSDDLATALLTAEQKTELLIGFLRHHKPARTLIFTRTKHRAKRVAEKVKDAGHESTSLQGTLSQNRRKAALDAFRAGKVHVLVATDIAARGIDVSQISHVINYDVPEHAEDYVHRIGRTGRAMTEGDAVTLVSFEEERMIPGIEAFIGQEIARKALDGFSYLVPPRLHTYKAPMSSKFRIRRVIPRGSGARFRR